MPRFKADLGELSRIRDFVTEAAKTLGVEPSAFDDLRIAVDEAVTNVVMYGYSEPGEIALELSANGSDLVVKLSDEAAEFDSAATAPDEIDSAAARAKPGGFGLYLIKQAMDDISHRSLHPGNELTMIKRDVIGKG